MSRLKECFECKSVKPIEEFYKSSKMADGHLNKCKECRCRESTEYRNANLEKVRAYDRERAKTKSRIANSIAITRVWRAQDKRRAVAHSAVARAVRCGTLTRLPCESCGNPESVAHHDDYDKPLDVRWLCPACHCQYHKSMMRNQWRD